MTGSMVNSANGNEYMLTYADGAWAADFQPVSMAIEGTGLTAMTREGPDDMYDVGDTTLAATGVGDITVDGAMYHVWMQDEGLAGARYDDKQKDGRSNIGIADPALSAQDDAGLLAAQGIEEETTVANELQTHLKIKGEYFSIGTLLGAGQASRVGAGQSTIVSSALEEVRDLRQKAVATLDVYPDAGDAAARTSALASLWTKVRTQVNLVFGDKVTLPSARRDNRILDDFDDIITALSDEGGFQAATASGGGGVFAGAKLSADAAASAFAAEKVEATATFGAVGNTRFGAFWKKERTDAISKLGRPSGRQPRGVRVRNHAGPEDAAHAARAPRDGQRVLRRRDASGRREGEFLLRRHRDPGPLRSGESQRGDYEPDRRDRRLGISLLEHGRR